MINLSLIGGIILGVLMDVFFFRTQLVALNIFLLQLLFLGFTLFINHKKHRKLEPGALVSGGFALAFSAVFAIWSAPNSISIATAGWLVSNYFFFFYVFGNKFNLNHPLEFIPFTFRRMIAQDFAKFKVFRGDIKEQAYGRWLKTDTGRGILVGIVILIPLLLIFVGLFAGADAVFASKTENFFNWFYSVISPETIGHLFFTTFFIFFFWYILYATVVRDMKLDWTERVNRKDLFLPLSIVFIGLEILFGLFIILQIKYLFGGHEAIQNFGITYSDYATQGFGQLTAVSMLTILLIMTARHWHRGKRDNLLNILYTVLILQTSVILASATYRIWLYIEAYGLTYARIQGLWGAIVIMALLAMLIFNLYNRANQAHFMQGGLIFVGVASLLLIISNPEAISIKYQANQLSDRQEITTREARDFLRVSADGYNAVNSFFARDGLCISTSPYGDYAFEGPYDRWISRIKPTENSTPQMSKGEAFEPSRARLVALPFEWNYSRSQVKDWYKPYTLCNSVSSEE